MQTRCVDLRARVRAAWWYPTGGGGGRLDFSQVAVFTPRGEAAVGPSPVAFADIGLRPVRTAGSADPNVAIIQMSGLTGVQRVYRQ